MRKTKSLAIPANIYNWIISFLSDRVQVVKGHGSVKSQPLSINLGTIQGSGLGPTLYIIMKKDLKALSVFINILFKFADDTTLTVPRKTDFSIVEEFEHVLHWAAVNKMKINKSKTKEIVFHRLSVRHDILPCQIDGVDQVIEANLLGVIFGNRLNFDSHVIQTLKICSQRMYILKQLMHQGLPVKQLQTICCSIIISRIMYAACAWGGHLSAYLIGKINTLLQKLKKYGYMTDSINFETSLAQADHDFFKKISNIYHCANCLLSWLNIGNIDLRNKGHQYYLPNCKYETYKKSYVPRILFSVLKFKYNV